MDHIRQKTSQRHKFQMYIDKNHYDEMQRVAGFEDRSVASLIRQIVASILRYREVAEREAVYGSKKNRR